MLDQSPTNIIVDERDMNHGSLVLEATLKPRVPQPLS